MIFDRQVLGDVSHDLAGNDNANHKEVPKTGGAPSHHGCFNTKMVIHDDWMIWGHADTP